MANNLNSNFTEKLLKIFLKSFVSQLVLIKGAMTQKLPYSQNLTSDTGGTVSFKRPHDYRSIRTDRGDISAENKNQIIAGKATGVVQPFMTVPIEWDGYEEALELAQLEEIIAPAAVRVATDIELDFAKYMLANCGLTSGTYGNPITTWSDIAEAGALMKSTQIPPDEWYCTVNPYTQAALSQGQTTLAAGGVAGQLISTAYRNATISESFAGFRVMTSTSLGNVSHPNITDRVGALNGDPDVTYVTAKDTMTQTMVVKNFGSFTGTVPAGTVIQAPAANRLGLANRETILTDSGGQVPWTGTLVEDASLSSGGGTFVVTGPAIQETEGQYNTVDADLVNNDVVTILGSANSIVQPAIACHKQAFGVGFVELPRLYDKENARVSQDGISIRVVRYSDGDANVQRVRFDILPAFVTYNPFFACQVFGVS
jgi:hypothetical protein